MIFKRCPKCGRILTKDCATCSYCGYDFSNETDESTNSLEAEDFSIKRKRDNIKKRCPQCGRIMADSTPVCSHCGYVFEGVKEEVKEESIIEDTRFDGRRYSIKKRCPKCGRILSEASEICSFCGYRFYDDEEEKLEIFVEEMEKELAQEQNPVTEEAEEPIDETKGFDGRRFAIKKRCPKCGRILSPDADHCYNCGYMFEKETLPEEEILVEEPREENEFERKGIDGRRFSIKKRCLKCGRILSPYARVCYNCGYLFENVPEEIIPEDNTSNETPINIDEPIVEPAQEIIEVQVPENESKEFDVIFGIILYKYNGTNKTVTIPDEVEVIDENAFADNETIEKLVLNSNVKFIERNAFKNCVNLKTIEFNDIDRLEIDVDAFYCDKEVEEGKGINSIVYDVRRMVINKNNGLWVDQTPFKGELFKNTKKLTLGEHVEIIAPCLFNRLTGVKKIKLPKSINEIGPCAFRYPLSKDYVNKVEFTNRTGWKVLINDEQVATFKIPENSDLKENSKLINEVHYSRIEALDEENYIERYCRIIR